MVTADLPRKESVTMQEFKCHYFDKPWIWNLWWRSQCQKLRWKFEKSLRHPPTVFCLAQIWWCAAFNSYCSYFVWYGTKAIGNICITLTSYKRVATGSACKLWHLLSSHVERFIEPYNMAYYHRLSSFIALAWPLRLMRVSLWVIYTWIQYCISITVRLHKHSVQ